MGTKLTRQEIFTLAGEAQLNVAGVEFLMTLNCVWESYWTPFDYAQIERHECLMADHWRYMEKDEPSLDGPREILWDEFGDGVYSPDTGESL